MENIILIIVNSLFCYGVWISFSGDMIFSSLREKYENTLILGNGRKSRFFYMLSKPLFNCVVCMASIWGAIFVLFSRQADFGVVSWDFVVHVVCVAGLNFLIAEKLDSYKTI